MRHNILLLLLTLVFGVGLQAQPIREPSINQKLEAAKMAEEEGNYARALEYYDQAYDQIRKTSRNNPLSKELTIKIGDMNYALRDYKKASNYYKRMVRGDDELMYVNERLKYGKSLKQEAKYDLALEVLNEFISVSEDEEFIKEAEFEIAGIEQLREMEPNVESFIKPLGKNVNSGSAEFSPRELSDGTLMFASFDRNDPIDLKDEESGFHAKIFMAAKSDDGKYGKKTELDQKVNRKEFHNTHLAVSRDNRTLYFTRVQTTRNAVTDSKILRSYNRDSGWSAADLVPTINGDWNAKHPAVGQLFGKDVLFFASDMEGGLGGLDIFYSNINADGSMSAPVNLGPNINTPQDDEYPFYFEGTLYFSTVGRPTIGGYDIFYSVWDGSNWSEAENMGLGYNSANDDIAISFGEDGMHGFFVSNRPFDGKRKMTASSTCCDDIFSFNIRQIVIDLLAIVVDEEGLPINAATIALDNLTDPVNYPTDTKFNALSNEFQFLLDSDFSYRGVARAEGYYPDTIEFNTAGILDSYTVNKKVTLKKIPIEREVTEVVKINEPIRLNNIYYDFNDDKILPDAEIDLNLILGIMDEYPEMVIEMSSHTDSRGRDGYNLDLSQRRANSARTWLIEQGVEDDRIKAVGYGETKILNRCKNNVRCSEEEHRQNRRTEFKILEGPTTITITREIKKTVIE
ncbi:MAG: OmpA family protein [Saprospiraceae bacterium]|nr:OmpA family protein [Saprospiraceae bacterium]